MNVYLLLKDRPRKTLLQRIFYIAVLDSPKMSSQQTCISCFSVEVIHSKQSTGTEIITKKKWKDLNNSAREHYQQEKSSRHSLFNFS